MHSEAQLNDVAVALRAGAWRRRSRTTSEKRLLLLDPQSRPSLEQRICVYQWAAQNGLKAVVSSSTSQFPEPS